MADGDTRRMPDGHDNGIRSYVLRQGRMTDAQKHAILEFGPRWMLPYTGKPMDPSSLFDPPRPVVMEIGFGMGLATWQIARARADLGFLGCEVHGPGVGRLLQDIAREGLENLRIIQHDAVEVLQSMIPERSLAGLHIFYPDPWPKKRHHKRRLLRSGIAELMVSRLEPGGYLYFVTDIEDYGRATLELLSSIPELENTAAALEAAGAADRGPDAGFCAPQAWRPETKFQRRATEASRLAWELMFVRRA